MIIVHYFKNMGSTKKNNCISKFYGSFYIYYLLTTPGSFKLNLRTPSLSYSYPFGIIGVSIASKVRRASVCPYSVVTSSWMIIKKVSTSILKVLFFKIKKTLCFIFIMVILRKIRQNVLFIQDVINCYLYIHFYLFRFFCGSYHSR